MVDGLAGPSQLSSRMNAVSFGRIAPLLVAALLQATWSPCLCAVNTTYIGCFNDSTPHDLSYWAYDANIHGTVPICAEVCLAGNYSFAGLQMGGWCFCGNSYGTYGQLAESSCPTPCAGDSQQKCGGTATSSVYAIDKTSASSAMSNSTGSFGGAVYLGCFNENMTAPDLSISAMYSSNNKASLCTWMCGIFNFSYAGVFQVYNCRCGNSYGRYNQTAEGNCSWHCPSTYTEMCGGDSLTSLYAVIRNGVWTAWVPWAACSATCRGQAAQTRTRSCTNPPPNSLGSNCSAADPTNEQHLCSTIPCTAHKLNFVRISIAGSAARLFNHTVAIQVAQDVTACSSACLQNVNCISFNFGELVSGNNCELNNESHLGDPASFIPSSSGWQHYYTSGVQ